MENNGERCFVDGQDSAGNDVIEAEKTIEEQVGSVPSTPNSNDDDGYIRTSDLSPPTSPLPPPDGYELEIQYFPAEDEKCDNKPLRFVSVEYETPKYETIHGSFNLRDIVNGECIKILGHKIGYTLTDNFEQIDDSLRQIIEEVGEKKHFGIAGQLNEYGMMTMIQIHGIHTVLLANVSKMHVLPNSLMHFLGNWNFVKLCKNSDSIEKALLKMYGNGKKSLKQVNGMVSIELFCEFKRINVGMPKEEDHIMCEKLTGLDIHSFLQNEKSDEVKLSMVAVINQLIGIRNDDCCRFYKEMPERRHSKDIRVGQHGIDFRSYTPEDVPPSKTPQRTSEKTFTCALCNVTVLKDDINTHLLEKHDSLSVKCEVCDIELKCGPVEVLAHFMGLTHFSKVNKFMGVK